MLTLRLIGPNDYTVHEDGQRIGCVRSRAVPDDRRRRATADRGEDGEAGSARARRLMPRQRVAENSVVLRGS